ncbi:hypothetical protein [Hymenobacter fodinae]|uniref:Uncharacterized protein n=1 Tax=Hymenobacter fodinae TaxID=2510796 RepID=A0A4Z0P4J2_9BACT|nr:hypothetical protein [Hymenobacter fodinae]TGE06096.1 hypothetical protein EU556_14610 [Hymenobacter fodinae]
MRKYRRWFRNTVLVSWLSAGLFATMLATPAGRVFDRAVSAHFNWLAVRYLRTGKLTWGERVQLIALYKLIALGGHIISPEGGAIIRHYLWEGKGRDLHLDSAHIRSSPVIIRQLASMRVGEVRRVTFRMNEDYRLACALNPLNLHKEKDRVIIWQRIAFARDTNTYTRLDYGLGRILLLDAAIHALRPAPFTVHCSWRY